MDQSDQGNPEPGVGVLTGKASRDVSVECYRRAVAGGSVDGERGARLGSPVGAVEAGGGSWVVPRRLVRNRALTPPGAMGRESFVVGRQ